MRGNRRALAGETSPLQDPTLQETTPEDWNMDWASLPPLGRRLVAVGLVLITAIAALSSVAAAREVVPTPPGGGPGIHLFPADQENPTNLPAPRLSRLDLRGSPSEPPPGLRDPDLGGDDILVRDFTAVYEVDLAIASNGDLFAVVEYDVDDDGIYRLVVRRSDDGGTTWRDWASFNPAPDHRYWNPVIHIAEGDVDRCFIGYALDTGSGWPGEVHVAWSSLDLANGDFSHDTILHAADTGISSISLTSDAASYSAYYVYAVFSADDGDGSDIHFVRSTDQGTSWESSYVIGTISVNDRGYYLPHVEIGFGGYVHVVWMLGFPDDHEYDDALRYRRASGYAGGGLASWGNIQSLSSHANGVDELWPVMDAATTSLGVLIGCARRVREPGGGGYWDGVSTLSSADGGSIWSGLTSFGSGLVWPGDVVYQDATDRWLLGLDEYSSWGLRWAPAAAPADWSDLQVFSDDFYSSGEPELVLDPSHEDRIGMVGGNSTVDGFEILFDAEWRTDPGYPNFAPGFPVVLEAEAVSDPAVVDLDGDGDLEIVFGDSSGRIRAYRDDGSPLPGWPVVVGASLSSSPIAVGDLDGDGDQEVVAGTTNGRAYAYSAGGSLLPGWPYITPNPAAAYVAIGGLGGFYRRVVVVGSGDWIGFVGIDGLRIPGSVSRIFPGRTIQSAPAIGDVDGDDQGEVVVAASQSVYAFPMDTAEWNIIRSLEADVTGGVALGDFDLDGDAEVVAPLANGVVHLMYGDGTEFPGDWPVTVATSQLMGAAIAQCLGTGEPEIAITALSWLVSVLRFDGAVGSGWPNDTEGWRIYGKPIIARVEGSSSDVAVGARGYKGWAWDNLARLIPGWPKTFDDHVYRTPAYGDVDLDGNAEIVFLTQTQLALLDIGTAPNDAYRTWGMAGHDPQRTGCADCPEDVSAVDDAASGVTRVTFASPWPNPITAEATFSFALPVRAKVDLAIYDVAGRRLATVERAELPAGRQEIAWRGFDHAGRPVPSGQYIAELRVRGPGLDETLRRKVTILR